MIHGHGGNIYALAQKLGCRPEEIIDVSSNINPLGPPPGLMDYLKEHMAAICSLPEVDSRTITAQMAASLGVDQGCVLAGAGTTQFIHAMFAVLRSRRVLILGPTYADYADACRMQMLEPRHFLADAQDRFLPDMARLDPQVGNYDTVVICNPNNPTGVMMPKDGLLTLCRQHPDTHFVVDESYLPFVPEADSESMAASGLDNVIVLHSLSKIFRLPGLRIGFLISTPATVERFQRITTPWCLNSLAQAAVYFLHDNRSRVEGFIRETRVYISDERKHFFQVVKQNGDVTLYPSRTSYFLIQLPAYLTADQVCEQFEKERILIRNCGNFHGLTDKFVRIAINQSDVNRRVAEIFVGLKPMP